MADIFLSYAREDIESARVLADTLAERGWTVWWDRKIIPGRSFASTIDFELNAAKCVVALWSKASVNSNWCKNEADVACKRGVLVPALLEADVEIPLAFRHLQAADITDFNPISSDPGFEQLIQAVAELLAQPVPAPVEPPPRWRALAAWWRTHVRRRWVALSVVMVAGLCGVLVVRHYVNRSLIESLRIEGIVSDSNGQPVPDALVTIDGIQFGVRSNQDGHFLGTLPHVYTGSVLTLHVQHPPEYTTYTDNYSVDGLTRHLLQIRLGRP